MGFEYITVQNVIYFVVMLALVIFFAGIRFVRPHERGLHERFGKYIGTRDMGFRWIIPVIDRMIKVDITENMVDVEPQKVITKDSLNADVDAVVYFKVLRPHDAVYHAQDYKKQIASLCRTTLRDLLGKMTLTDANSQRSIINGQLEKELDKQTNAWGIDIVRVELQRIEPPKNVQEAMNEVVEAENKKISAINFANAVETEADGKRRASIKEADGRAYEIERIAKANADKIKVENEAMQRYFKNEAQVYKKLQTTENALKKATKFVIDPNSNITNVISEMSGVTPIKATGKNK